MNRVFFTIAKLNYIFFSPVHMRLDHLTLCAGKNVIVNIDYQRRAKSVTVSEVAYIVVPSFFISASNKMFEIDIPFKSASNWLSIRL